MRLTFSFPRALLALAGMLAVPKAFATAVVTGGIAGCNFATGNVNGTCVIYFIAHLIELVFGIVGAIFFIMLIIAGYQIALGPLTGTDNSAGKARLRFAIVGFIVSALSYTIINFFVAALGI